MAEYRFDQLVDLDRVRSLLQAHHKITGVCSAILDPEQNILVAEGWEDICTRFHRVHPVTCARCLESNELITHRLHEEEEGCRACKCENGLWDIAMPIVIDGRMVASFWIGQFFYDEEEKDEAFFRAQAAEFGFDEETYIAALRKVPVFTREQIRNMLDFYRDLVHVVAKCGLKTLKLAREVEEREKAEKAQEAAKDYLEKIINSISDPIFVKDRQHRLVLVNDAECALAGRSREEMLGKTDYDFFPRDQVDVFWEKDEIVFETGEENINEEEITDAQGAKRIIVTKKTLYVAPNGKEHIVGIIRDITERKQTEEQLSLLNYALNKVREAVFLIDDYARFLYVNDEACRVLGYSRDELLSMSVGDIDPDWWEKNWYDTWPILKAQGSLTVETCHKARDGRIFPVEVTGSYFEYQGQSFSLALARDITERKRAEGVNLARLRLLQFAATHTLEELLQATLDEVEALTGSAIGFYHFVEPDQKTLSLQGWSTRTLAEFCTAAGKGMKYDVARAGAWVDCVRQRRPVVHNDYTSLPHRKGMPAGHPPVVRELVVPLMRVGRIVAVLGVANKPENYTDQDVETVSIFADLAWEIIERKRMEEQLRESEQRYRDVFENVSDALYLLEVTEDGRFRNIEVNPALERSTGLSREEMIGRYVDEAVSNETGRAVVAKYRRCLETGSVIDEEVALDLPAGRRYFHSTLMPVRDDTGKIHRIAGITRDITDSKRAEELLLKRIELENRLEKLAEASPGAVMTFQLLPDGTARIPYASPRTEELTGFRPEELAHDVSDLRAAIHPNDIEAHLGSIAESSRTLRPWQNEFRIHHPDKGWVWIEGRSAPERQADGSTIWYGFLHDITTRKRQQAQEEIRLRIFERLAQGGDLMPFLRLVVEYVDMANPDFIGNIMLADDEGKYLHPACSCGLPEDYLAAVEKVKIGEGVGSCATAAWRGETVIADDLRTHPFWVEYNRPALKAGLLSCWSEPILGASGTVLGTISIYRRRAGSPTGEDRELMRRACHLAAIAIERKRSLELLHKREQAFRAVVENSPDTIARYDADCRRIYVNPTMQRLFGLPENEILGKTPVELSPLPEADAFMQMAREVRESGREIQREVAYRNANGEVRWGDLRVVPEFGPDAKVASLLSIGRDITERYQAERALKESEERYRSLFEESIDGVIVTSEKGKIIDVNKTAVRIFGYETKEEMTKLDMSRDVYANPEDRKRFLSIIDHEGSGEYDAVLKKKNGETILAYCAMTVIRNRKGAITGYQGVIRDITDQKRMEKELFAAKKMEIIGQLAGGVAHEVRNPLNALLSISEALFREKDIAGNPEYEPYIQHIRTQVGRLSKLMSDLLDLGKPIKPENIHPVSLYEVLTDTIGLWTATDRTRKNRLKFSCDRQAPALLVTADPSRLQQALLNILDNAAQHSSNNDPISLHIGEPVERWVAIQVRDAGKGIPPAKLEKVFEPFYTTRTGGTGLGLPLVKHIIESMGGEVRLFNNDPSPGCTAELKLQVERRRQKRT